MASFSADLAGPAFGLVLAGLFLGTLVYLARLNERLAALRGAQSELHGLLRACSDAVDGAERSIATLRSSAESMAGDLGRTLEEAEALKREMDVTIAAIRRLSDTVYQPAPPKPPVARLAEEEPATAPDDPRAEPRWKSRDPGPTGERAALRLFRDTIRSL